MPIDPNSEGSVTAKDVADYVSTHAAGIGGGGKCAIPISQSGTLTTGVGAIPLVMPGAGTIIGVIIGVGTAPTGHTIIVDVNKNGSTVFTTQANRPTIAISGTVSNLAVPDTLTFVAGDLFTWDIDAIGSGTAGSNLGGSLLVSFS